ncbi:MAG: Uma2 family endonuclease [Limnothrix sp. RL_2_0]|nr:Uma2 family endonuclease [Limnothrix sp. RL_2_0]
MIAFSSDKYLTPEEYLELEKTSEIRHAYIDGEIYAMASGTQTHNILCLNLAVLLRRYLKDSICQTFMADMKVQLQDQRKFFYPDLIVSCDGNKNFNLNCANSPTVIFEVLSPSTEGFDRGDKFKFYRSLPSLEEYILVSSNQYSVDCFRRSENDFWVLQSYQGLDAMLHLKSLNIEVSLTDIYETIVFENSSEVTG